ncbi:MAG: hypothetical protein ACFNZX_06845, partial [Actinomyces sp.]
MKDRSTDPADTADTTDAAGAPWDWARYLRAILRAPVYEAADNTLGLTEMIESYDEVFAHVDRMP